MQSILHRIAIAPAVIMVATLAASPAIAETTGIKVPFGFEVAGKTFPAGDYSIRRDNRDGFVTLASKESSQSFTSIIGPGSPSPLEYKIALKFDLVGQTHLLQSIQYGTMITSKLDKKALESERELGPVAHSGGR
ncbi:hypothetical protein H7849_20380 [Alloacidobacterium dinghuense]|uniref:Uncharacterized protein n=1 Tax=Alloacidobacterium dinghuense TaxID=2763107 RepID=A0A7G8BFT9_9BACT|nr:hypothetical protein [Alloacidobacterium dinghuense]QNI31409.1 hypothetical protein H7849_20380 [Alloacidobacterium dinghuense]